MDDDELKGILEALRQDSAAMREDSAVMRQENADAHAETRRHFDVALDAARHEIRLVAEGVAQTREALDREAGDIREDVRRTANETQAMIKFSHAELDRRMRTLEDAVSDLQARVERLETSPH